ncbi:MAG: hypothetical protein WA192_10205 [Candidatus Acidiferrales bacterium]
MRVAIRSGHARPEQKLALCAGSISLAPEDRAELLAVLATDSDPAVAERARGCLLTQPLQSMLAALSRSDADLRLFEYCADNLSGQPGVADRLAANTFCPAEFVTRASADLTSAGIQSLLDNLDRLSSYPPLGIALAYSESATPEQKELLAEIETNAVLDEKVIAEAAAEAEPDVKKRTTLLQRLATMNIVQRIQLAVKGGREERMLLIRDPNKIVQRGVLQSPRLTDLEIENFAAMTNVSQEVLRIISKNRNYMKSYVVAKNLTKNPKAPLDVTMHLLPRLTPTDLKQLANNKNIPETLRSTAQKLMRQRNTARSSE